MSLTIADVLPNGVRIWIIPHTLEVTNLKLRKVGQRVNIETDLLAKYTEKLLGKS
jgi:riboflavin synthase